MVVVVVGEEEDEEGNQGAGGMTMASWNNPRQQVKPANERKQVKQMASPREVIICNVQKDDRSDADSLSIMALDKPNWLERRRGHEAEFPPPSEA